MGPFCLNVNKEECAWSHHCVPCQWSNIVIPCLLHFLYNQYMTCIQPENTSFLISLRLCFAGTHQVTSAAAAPRVSFLQAAGKFRWGASCWRSSRQTNTGCSHLRAPSGVRLQSDISSERVEHLGKTVFLRLDAFLIWECPQLYTVFCLFRNDGREPEI